MSATGGRNYGRIARIKLVTPEAPVDRTPHQLAPNPPEWVEFGWVWIFAIGIFFTGLVVAAWFTQVLS